MRETELSVDHLIYPMFVVAGSERRTPIPTMPGIDHLSIDGAINGGELLLPIVHLLALALGYFLVARVSLRRFA